MSLTEAEKNVGAGEELWRHKDPSATQMHAFLREVDAKYKLGLENYADLYQWSVESLEDFWREVVRFTGVKLSQQPTQIMSSTNVMFPRPDFLPGARLNFAENLLWPASNPDPASTAILAATESTRESVSWSALRDRVQACQHGMKTLGVKSGDRVAGYVGNHVNAIVIMLAAASLGAIWTGVSPDSGVSMVLDRLKQIEPVLLFADAQQEYNGKLHDVLPKVKAIVAELTSLKAVVLLPKLPEGSELSLPEKVKLLSLGEFEGQATRNHSDMTFEQLPPDHPVYILYSSGTTGAPKCIVHGAVGTLLQHKKEHILHCDIKPGERLFYFTTCTWMMWHWLVSGLAVGATLVLYDGSPMRYTTSSSPPGSAPDDLAMPRLIDELEINHFGTSAKYLSLLEQKGIFPRKAPNNLSLATLRAIYNTASPLAPSTFRYVYEAFGSDLMLSSITGGTDIISLFGAGSPLAPVYAGEVQVPGLGMAIRAFTEDGTDVTEKQQPGDLVCVKPFPCQPVFFWPPGAEGEAKYEKSYFQRFYAEDKHALWHHGDFVQFYPHATGSGLVMLGRSDGVLNPAGIRFGSAEIYNIILRHFPGRISDGLCIGRRRDGEADETVVLFVKMEQGQKFDEALAKEIKTTIRGDLSARHVPAIVDECPDIPMTINGKKIESAIKQIISGSKVKTSASVANAECLDFYRAWAEKN
ncbi:hypothetical protein FH972_022775 [Carpinus fangiana]|uniref:AMP-dependent synthetase/ligase domain-containing protein n=1 Tax=Carpinus fangiana TaxID=176857 RepID=A0A5N6KTQ5_9ROSI|nr:hypothetical protein FH972_022775 [Carpinus fangiana]